MGTAAVLVGPPAPRHRRGTDPEIETERPRDGGTALRVAASCQFPVGPARRSGVFVSHPRVVRGWKTCYAIFKLRLGSYERLSQLRLNFEPASPLAAPRAASRLLDSECRLLNRAGPVTRRPARLASLAGWDLAIPHDVVGTVSQDRLSWRETHCSRHSAFTSSSRFSRPFVAESQGPDLNHGHAASLRSPVQILVRVLSRTVR